MTSHDVEQLVALLLTTLGRSQTLEVWVGIPEVLGTSELRVFNNRVMFAQQRSAIKKKNANRKGQKSDTFSNYW